MDRAILPEPNSSLIYSQSNKIADYYRFSTPLVVRWDSVATNPIDAAPIRFLNPPTTPFFLWFVVIMALSQTRSSGDEKKLQDTRDIKLDGNPGGAMRDVWLAFDRACRSNIA